MCPGQSISKKEPSKISEKIQCAYTLFLVHLPYSINKAIRIRVFYYPWHQHCIISVVNMRQNISSGISKNVFCKFRTKVGCNYAMILLWDITKKKMKKYPIIVLNNSIHPHHIIYFGIGLLIQLCVCY